MWWRVLDVDDVVAVRLRLRTPALPGPREVVLCLCGDAGHPPRSPGGPDVPPNEGSPLGQLLPSVDRPLGLQRVRRVPDAAVLPQHTPRTGGRRQGGRCVPPVDLLARD